jgi:serine/threonine-protein kinase
MEVLLDWTGAQADLEKALANEPADSVALARYGTLLALRGRLPEAIAHLKRATELDPLSTRAWTDLGVVFTESGEFAAAHAALHRALEIQPKSIYVPARLGTLELLEGHASQALATFRPMEMDDYRLSGIALAEHSLGHARESQQALDELIARYAQVDAYQIVQNYAWRGDKDRAFAWLERAYRQHDSGLMEVTHDPLLASLRGDARFAALLAKLHLP